MREAIGNSLILNIIIVFVAIFIALFVGALAFTKAFKTRNRMLDIIEKYGGYTEEAQLEIAENLHQIGYFMVDNVKCPDRNLAIKLNKNDNYNYCVYEYGSCVECTEAGGCIPTSGCDNDRGTYYGVRMYVHFDIPLIGNFMNIPIYGETRFIFDKAKVRN